jgi:hypothetical protein
VGGLDRAVRLGTALGQARFLKLCRQPNLLRSRSMFRGQRRSRVCLSPTKLIAASEPNGSEARDPLTSSAPRSTVNRHWNGTPYRRLSRNTCKVSNSDDGGI